MYTKRVLSTKRQWSQVKGMENGRSGPRQNECQKDAKGIGDWGMRRREEARWRGRKQVGKASFRGTQSRFLPVVWNGPDEVPPSHWRRVHGGARQCRGGQIGNGKASPSWPTSTAKKTGPSPIELSVPDIGGASWPPETRGSSSSPSRKAIQIPLASNTLIRPTTATPGTTWLRPSTALRQRSSLWTRLSESLTAAPFPLPRASHPSQCFTSRKKMMTRDVAFRVRIQSAFFIGDLASSSCFHVITPASH